MLSDLLADFAKYVGERQEMWDNPVELPTQELKDGRTLKADKTKDTLYIQVTPNAPSQFGYQFSAFHFNQGWRMADSPVKIYFRNLEMSVNVINIRENWILEQLEDLDDQLHYRQEQ